MRKREIIDKYVSSIQGQIDALEKRKQEEKKKCERISEKFDEEIEEKKVLLEGIKKVK